MTASKPWRSWPPRPSICYEALRALEDPALPAGARALPGRDLECRSVPTTDAPAGRRGRCAPHYNNALAALGAEAVGLLRGWSAQIDGITAKTYSYKVRDREITGDNYRESLSHQAIPKIAPPRFEGWGERLRFLMKENLPGVLPVHGWRVPIPPRG